MSLQHSLEFSGKCKAKNKSKLDEKQLHQVSEYCLYKKDSKCRNSRHVEHPERILISFYPDQENSVGGGYDCRSRIGKCGRRFGLVVKASHG